MTDHITQVTCPKCGNCIDVAMILVEDEYRFSKERCVCGKMLCTYSPCAVPHPHHDDMTPCEHLPGPLDGKLKKEPTQESTAGLTGRRGSA